MATTYKKIELVGTSPVSFAEAVKTAVEEAARSVRGMSWFEVVEERGAIRDGKVGSELIHKKHYLKEYGQQAEIFVSQLDMLENGRMVGIVTHTDVIRTLEEASVADDGVREVATPAERTPRPQS